MSRCSLVPLMLIFVILVAVANRIDAAAPANGANVQLRGSLNNARCRFERDKRGNVAFMGGSITEMNGYRPMVCDRLRERFPQTEFKFVDAGISSTCSTTGAFRLATDVLDRGPIDLFFVEFAVNDDQDAKHTSQECIRGMEGIVRHALQQNPNMDIVIVYFINPEMLSQWQSNQTPLTVAAHAEVAQHYGISTINLARNVAQQISAGMLTWEKFGGTHPAPFGNAICAKMIEELLDQAWKEPLLTNYVKQAHKLPEPLDRFSYSGGQFVDPKKAALRQGWRLEKPNWKELPGSCRDRFRDLMLLCGDGAGAELTLDFEGTAVGAYLLAGPDAGTLQAQIDNGPMIEVNLYHRFSGGLHYPRTVMFATELSPGPHRLTLRISDKTTSKGHAARLVTFVANQTTSE